MLSLKMNIQRYRNKFSKTYESYYLLSYLMNFDYFTNEKHYKLQY